MSNRSVSESSWKQTKTCLAPAGDGWGIRGGKSAVANCIPLVAQPFVLQPFEDVLPYERFAIRLSLPQVDELPRILDAVGPSELATMRRELERVRPAFVWGKRGRAYDYTLVALCHRAIELHGALHGGARDCAELSEPLPGARRSRRWPSWLPTAVKDAIQTLQAQRRAHVDAAGRAGHTSKQFNTDI